MKRLILLAALLAACANPEAPATPVNAPTAGVYSLASVNGQPLPFVLETSTGDAPYQVTLTGATLIMHADASWSAARTVQAIIAGNLPIVQLDPDSGAWQTVGDSVTLYTVEASSPQLVAWRGTFAPNTLTLKDAQYAYQFVKSP